MERLGDTPVVLDEDCEVHVVLHGREVVQPAADSAKLLLGFVDLRNTVDCMSKVVLVDVPSGLPASFPMGRMDFSFVEDDQVWSHVVNLGGVAGSSSSSSRNAVMEYHRAFSRFVKASMGCPMATFAPKGTRLVSIVVMDPVYSTCYFDMLFQMAGVCV